MSKEFPDPAHIAISKSRGMTIDWADGHKSQYSVAFLRDNCPCAVCRDPSSYQKIHDPCERAAIPAAIELGPDRLEVTWSDDPRPHSIRRAWLIANAYDGAARRRQKNGSPGMRARWPDRRRPFTTPRVQQPARRPRSCTVGTSDRRPTGRRNGWWRVTSRLDEPAAFSVRG